MGETDGQRETETKQEKDRQSQIGPTRSDKHIHGNALREHKGDEKQTDRMHEWAMKCIVTSSQ